MATSESRRLIIEGLENKDNFYKVLHLFLHHPRALHSVLMRSVRVSNPWRGAEAASCRVSRMGPGSATLEPKCGLGVVEPGEGGAVRSWAGSWWKLAWDKVSAAFVKGQEFLGFQWILKTTWSSSAISWTAWRAKQAYRPLGVECFPATMARLRESEVKVTGTPLKTGPSSTK